MTQEVKIFWHDQERLPLDDRGRNRQTSESLIQREEPVTTAPPYVSRKPGVGNEIRGAKSLKVPFRTTFGFWYFTLIRTPMAEDG